MSTPKEYVDIMRIEIMLDELKEKVEQLKREMLAKRAVPGPECPYCMEEFFPPAEIYQVTHLSTCIFLPVL